MPEEGTHDVAGDGLTGNADETNVFKVILILVPTAALTGVVVGGSGLLIEGTELGAFDVGLDAVVLVFGAVEGVDPGLDVLNLGLKAQVEGATGLEGLEVKVEVQDGVLMALVGERDVEVTASGRSRGFQGGDEDHDHRKNEDQGHQLGEMLHSDHFPFLIFSGFRPAGVLKKRFFPHFLREISILRSWSVCS